MKEAILYEKLEGKKVKCAVCNHRCTIADGKRGACGVRENKDGKLYALTYGKAISVAIDPIEKKPLYRFLPRTSIYSFATVGCNFQCAWCQNWEISQSSKPNKKVYGDKISPKEHVENALRYDCPSIAYTYTEPTIFIEYAFDTMKLAHRAGLKNVWVTNGYMTKETLGKILPYLDAVNVDFKGPDDKIYQKYCGGKAQPIMENLKTIHKAGVHLEVTTLVISDINDKPTQLKKIAEFIAKELSKDIPWHISRFFPAWQMMDTPITPIETLKNAEEIGRKAGLKHIYIGNI